MNARAELSYALLKYVYGLTLIVAGLDKLLSLNYVTNWDMYVSGILIQTVNVTPAMVVMFAGVAEIVVGILVLTKPRLGALIAVAWLGLIIANLLTMGTYYDIIVRDILIAVGFAQLVLRP